MQNTGIETSRFFGGHLSTQKKTKKLKKSDHKLFKLRSLQKSDHKLFKFRSLQKSDHKLFKFRSLQGSMLIQLPQVRDNFLKYFYPLFKKEVLEEN